MPDPSHHLKIKNKKGDRLLFLDGSGLSLGSGLANRKKNFPALDYPGISMIRPGPDVHAEKVACPLFLFVIFYMITESVP